MPQWTIFIRIFLMNLFIDSLYKQRHIYSHNAMKGFITSTIKEFAGCGLRNRRVDMEIGGNVKSNDASRATTA